MRGREGHRDRKLWLKYNIRMYGLGFKTFFLDSELPTEDNQRMGWYVSG